MITTTRYVLWDIHQFHVCIYIYIYICIYCLRLFALTNIESQYCLKMEVNYLLSNIIVRVNIQGKDC